MRDLATDFLPVLEIICIYYIYIFVFILYICKPLDKWDIWSVLFLSLYPWHVKQFLGHRRCSINICWMNSESDRYQFANILLLIKTNHSFIIIYENKYNFTGKQMSFSTSTPICDSIFWDKNLLKISWKLWNGPFP